VGDVAKGGPLSTHINPVGQAESAGADGRDGRTEGPVCGAEHSGPPPTVFNSSRVTDEEADARSEWRYKPQRHASRKSASGDTDGRPSAGVRGHVPRSFLASRTGESHSSDAAILRIKGVMTWTEQQFTASATAFKSRAAHVAPSVPGESISFHSIMNCRNLAYVLRFLFYLFS
jgi:hypothetical protein